MAEVRSSASPLAGARFEWTPSTPLAELRRVRVGSTNEPKLEAVRNALAPYAPQVEVAGVVEVVEDLEGNTGISSSLGWVRLRLR